MTFASPPYPMIWDGLRKGRIVPFLGAGASLAARPDGTVWCAKKSDFPPSVAELSAFLAAYANYPKDEPTSDLAKVASYARMVGGPDALRECLAEVFNRDYRPGPVHELLADVPGPMLIVTTNYDDLIECAFTARGKPFHVVQWTNHREFAGSVVWWRPGASKPQHYPPKVLPLPEGDKINETIIYKMHGAVDRHEGRHDSFLITEEDYIEFLAGMTHQAGIPATFKQLFQKSSFLFLGYGLADWNLRVLLCNLKSQRRSGNGSCRPRSPTMIVAEDKLRSCAVQLQPSPLESFLWQRREIDIYNFDVNDFVAQVRECTA
jgi:SIR2-like domain